MKSVLKLAQLRGKTALTNEATILALLVCWALQQQEAQQARDVFAQASSQVATLTAVPEQATETREHTVSSWLLTALCVQTLRTVVCRGTGRLHACGLASPTSAALCARVHADGCSRKGPFVVN